MILLVHFDRVTKNFGICSNPLSRVQAFNASKKPVGRLDEIGIKNIFDDFFPHFLSLSCRISQKSIQFSLEGYCSSYLDRPVDL